jgi:transposase
MIRIDLSEQEKKRLKQERYEHPDPAVQKRASALHFLGLGYKHYEVCNLADISSSTLTRISKKYLNAGIEAALRSKQYESGGELEQHRDSIEEHFQKHPPATVKEACAAIKDLTGVERKETQVRKFLLRIGMKPRKVGSVPGKADREKQEEFKKKSSSQN